jgi:hypothetical protein
MLPPFLAESDTDWVKLVLFGIGLVIWAVGAVASKVSKAQKEAAARRRWTSASPQTAQVSQRRPAYVVPPGAAPFPPPGVPQVAPPPPVARRQVKPPPVPRSKTKRRKPVAPPQAEQVPVALAEAPAGPPLRAPRDAAAPRTAPSSGLTARDIADWLRPEVMRQQYILTEVFDPPPALREAR